MFLLPYEADVTMYRWPYANVGLIIAITLVSVMAFAESAGSPLALLVLNGWGPIGMVGHVFLHGGILHLLGNMMFLWTFGNAVCAKWGDLPFLAIFFGLAVASATIHNLFDGHPAIGASGAINGVVGLFLVYFPRNDIRCFWYIFVRAGTFGIGSIWMILLWLAFDIWGAASGSGGVAYWAHLGGFGAGVALGIASLRYDWVEMTDTECSLVEMMGSR